MTNVCKKELYGSRCQGGFKLETEALFNEQKFDALNSSNHILTSGGKIKKKPFRKSSKIDTNFPEDLQKITEEHI